jgi:geranylgeranyl pyrophosphate synthase
MMMLDGVVLQVSVAAGAILAGASPEEVKACETYAVDIGLAFQGTKPEGRGVLE